MVFEFARLSTKKLLFSLWNKRSPVRGGRGTLPCIASITAGAAPGIGGRKRRRRRGLATAGAAGGRAAAGAGRVAAAAGRGRRTAGIAATGASATAATATTPAVAVAGITAVGAAAAVLADNAAVRHADTATRTSRGIGNLRHAAITGRTPHIENLPVPFGNR